MSQQKESDWEERFDTRFNPRDSVPSEIRIPGQKFLGEIKSFIKEVLSKRENEIAEEIENKDDAKYYFVSYAHGKGLGNIFVESTQFLDIRATEKEIEEKNPSIGKIAIMTITEIDKRQYVNSK